VGPLLITVIAIVTVHCMFLLVQCSHAQSNRTKSMSLGYAELAEKCIGQYYPDKTHLGRYIVNTFLLITEVGFCCIYLLFVAQSLQEAFKAHVDLDVKEWVAVLLLPVILLSYIRTLKVMAFLSALSNVLYIIGITCLLVYAGRTISDDKDLPEFAGWKTVPLTFGTIMMTFEGIGVASSSLLLFCSSALLLFCSSALLLFCSSALLLFCSSALLLFCSSALLLFCSSALLLFCSSALLLFCSSALCRAPYGEVRRLKLMKCLENTILPVENMMAKPRYFYCVLNLGMGIVTVVYMLISVLGYLSCGLDCKDSFTLNLSDSPYHTAVKLILAASIFSSYFIQFYVPMSIILPPLKDKVSSKYKSLLEYAVRTVAVCFTASLAVGIPQLGNLISLIGAVGSTALAVILPASFHILTFRYDKSLSTLCLCKDVLLIVVGIVAASAALFTSIVNIVNGFKHPSMATINNGTHSNSTFTAVL
ncbi:hypothetical protein QZH41_014332, partial [Actinostola sp. cb2023]